MAFFATVTLTYSGTSIVLPAPTPGYQSSIERAQALGQTAAGAYYVYDKDFVNYFTSLTFELSETQKNDLEDFFNNQIKAGLNQFTYIDHKNITHNNVRLRQTDLPFNKTTAARYSVTLSLITEEALD